VADNAAGCPPAGLGGADPTITIPSVRVTLPDGNALKLMVGLNVTLQVGGVKQEVVVTAAAQPLATGDARLGQTIRNEVYTALPLVMNTGGPRDPTAFMSLMPGVQSIGRWGNVMGGQDFTTDMYVEGVPITNAVVQGEGRNMSFGISVEAVDQFQVETDVGTARAGLVDLHRQDVLAVDHLGGFDRNLHEG